MSVRVTGTQQECAQLVQSLTDGGCPLPWRVFEASGFYPNRRTGTGELGRVYLQVRPTPGTGPEPGTTAAIPCHPTHSPSRRNPR